MNKRRLLLVFLPAFLLFSLACSLADQVLATLAPTPTPTPETKTAAPTGPEVQLEAGLAQFQSYSSRLTLSFSGQDTHGSPTLASLEVVEEEDRPSGLRHLLAHSDLQGQKPGSVDIYQGAKVSYLVSTERNGCLQLTTQTLAARQEMSLRPADLFQSLRAGERVAANQVMNGLSSDQYRLRTIQLRLGAARNGDAQVWIATNGGYVVRLKGWAEGQLSVGAGGSYGRVEWDYNLTGLNQTKISLPGDCQALAKNDLPIPPGASDLLQNGSDLSFHIASPPAVVMDFYRRELMKLGWTVEVDAGGGSAFTQAAVKENQSIQMLVFSAADGADVKIRRQ